MVAQLILIFMLSGLPASAWDANDRKTIPEPRERRIAETYDFIVGSVFQPFSKYLDIPRDFRKLFGMSKPAMDVNAFDEVPNSSWFTNRNFFKPLSPDEIRRGPPSATAPDAGPWTVTKCKSNGISPGFQIRDSKGDVYLLKFDSAEFPELTSAADVITSRFLYAAGYNVPLNSVVVFDQKILIPKPDLLCTLSDGKKTPMTTGSLSHLLENVGRTDDGRIRAMASKFLEGTPKGPFSYVGTRHDDPNDQVQPEHRRELRGLRVIAAFLNHVDCKQLNTLDMYVNEGGQKFLKHHLIDFGASLGSATLAPKQPGDGQEYFVDPGEMFKSAITFGIYRRPDERPDHVKYLSIGAMEGADFRPERWKGDEPIASFDNMTDVDGYWAAKIVASFTDEQIAAGVSTGQYSDPVAEHALIELLKQRRDRVADYWFRRVAPLDHFQITANGLIFEDLAVEATRDVKENVKYTLRLRSATTTSKPVYVSPTTAYPIQVGDVPVEARIMRSSPGWPDLIVSVFLKRVNGIPTIAGIRR